MDIISPQNKNTRQKKSLKDTYDYDKLRNPVRSTSTKEPSVYQLGEAYHSQDVPLFGMSQYAVKHNEEEEEQFSVRTKGDGMGSIAFMEEDTLTVQQQEDAERENMTALARQEVSQIDANQITLQKLFSRARYAGAFPTHFVRQMSLHFGMVALAAFLVTSSVVFVAETFAVKDRVLQSSDVIKAAAQRTVEHTQGSDLNGLLQELTVAHEAFVDAQEEVRSINKFAIWTSQFIPGASKLSSGDALIAIGVELTSVSQRLVSYAHNMMTLRETTEDGVPYNFLTLAEESFAVLHELSGAFAFTQEQLDVIRDDDLPAEGQAYITELRRLLPALRDHTTEILALENVVEDVVGKNGTRTYLFLFQNNQEARATGGFIGSYGLLNISHGEIKEFFVDGIYNPDGQLVDKIVPPLPVQKISAAWSLHDSNWWPDFPQSAEVAIDFYERTGGRSVDGVIMMTPTMMEKLLAITGPIYMEDYDVTLTQENFIEMTQYKVEVDYDAEQNRPKKILSDLVPLVLDRLSQDLSAQKALRVIDAVMDGLDEKHILLYTRNEELQKYITEQHWGGRVQQTDGDYLSVINTNINGFKTDGVIDQNITYHSKIQEDGRIINTVMITREHRGGHTGREWWDAVNANYMRVYVPEGSRLISVEGHTREMNDERLAYDKIGFERYDEVVGEEQEMQIHEESGTRMYTEAGKTVFANWAYVSPQETVRVVYTYELPWRVAFAQEDDGSLVGAHSLLLQKQSGTNNVTFESTIELPETYRMQWNTLDNHAEGQSLLQRAGTLDRDQYLGVVFTTVQ